MSDEVILVIGASKFLMKPQEAFEVATILNSCSRITQKWANGGGLDVITEPTIDGALIAPMSAYYSIKLAENMKVSK